MQRAAVRGARRGKDGHGRGRRPAQVHNTVAFRRQILGFASKSVRLSSCLSQTRPMAAFDIQARSEAEPGAKAHLEGAMLTKAHIEARIL